MKEVRNLNKKRIGDMSKPGRYTEHHPRTITTCGIAFIAHSNSITRNPPERKTAVRNSLTRGSPAVLFCL